MKICVLSLRGLFALCVFAAAFATGTARADDIVGDYVLSIERSHNLADADVEQVVAYSLAARQWTVRDRADSRVIGHIAHRGRDATVTFVIEPEKIAMYCDGWTVKKDGTRKKKDQPMGWLENLEKDIKKRMALKAVSE